TLVSRKAGQSLFATTTCSYRSACFIDDLRGLHQQTLPAAENRPRTRNVRRQNLEVPSFPSQHLKQSVLAREFACGGIDDFTALNPYASFAGCSRNLENRRTLGEAFQLDDIHQRLALHTAEATGFLPFEQRLDAVHEI